jgi:hypothetical protein
MTPEAAKTKAKEIVDECFHDWEDRGGGMHEDCDKDKLLQEIATALTTPEVSEKEIQAMANKAERQFYLFYDSTEGRDSQYKSGWEAGYRACLRMMRGRG